MALEFPQIMVIAEAELLPPEVIKAEMAQPKMGQSHGE
jgi:hypothetical protein